MLVRLITVALAGGLLAAGAFAQTERKRIVFFGDSITELGVRDGGYVRRIETALANEGIADRFELVGAGVSGNKVYDLYLRADADVLERKPFAVVVYVGVNDVWHKRLTGTGTDFDKFGKFYEALVGKFEAAAIRVIVCTPAVVGERTDFTNELDGELNLYSDWIRKLAKRRSLPLVDLRRAFLDHNLRNNPENKASGILTTDRVHLNDRGNELVAAEMLRAIRELK